MKKLIFLSLFLTTTAEAKRIVLDIPDEEVGIVETYVVDVEQWIKDAWKGKVNNRKEALIKEEVQHRLEKGMAIPASKEDIVREGMKRLGTRKERDTENRRREQGNGQ